MVRSACSTLVGLAAPASLSCTAPAPHLLHACAAPSHLVRSLSPRSLMSVVPTAAAVPVPDPPPAAAAAASAAAAAPVVAPEDGAAAPAQLYGYSAEQLAAWRPKFNAKLEGHLKTSRSLMEPSTARTIKALLQDWTTLDRKTKHRTARSIARRSTVRRCSRIHCFRCRCHVP